jgi:glyoxylase-like metal-dependent hydrolase (beta-lactamase superfamily II)
VAAGLVFEEEKSHSRRMKSISGLFLVMLASGAPLHAQLPAGIQFEKGPLNSVTIERAGQRLVIYGGRDPGADQVLITHVRRDLTEFARLAAGKSGKVIAPVSVADFLDYPSAHWTAWWEKRFDYYDQQVTRLPISPLAVAHPVAGGDTLAGPGGLEFRVLETPGYTREGITYLLELEGKKIAFSGDLILAGGRVPDLYSFQDAIPEAKIGGYHGYGGRLGQLVRSLETLAAEKPDLIVPLRGDLITDPQGDIAELITRVRAIYANYLSTNALNWYFKEERLTAAGRLVLGPEAEVELMDYSEHVDLPDWCKHLGTTKLLLADDGAGFVLDCGGPGPLADLRKALAAGLVTRIEGIFVTHTHNDHSAAVAEAAKEFGCPVYAVAEVADVLENPGAWFLPGTSANAVEKVTVLADGEKLLWKNYEFTAHFFPGQMYNHGALLVERSDHTPVFFIGDSFSPSGIDDYCLMNRNLMREDTGFFLCFKKVRRLPEGSWLVNQHIPHLFRFTPARLDLIEQRYRERIELINALTPWDDPNYAIDERWAAFYPYGQTLGSGATGKLELRVWNHSVRDREIRVKLHLPPGVTAARSEAVLTLSAHRHGSMIFPLAIANDAEPGVKVITADLVSDDFDLKQWAEALVKIE